jgi:hypothetical protein
MINKKDKFIMISTPFRSDSLNDRFAETKQDNFRTAKGMFFGIILSLIFWIGIGLLIFFAMC